MKFIADTQTLEDLNLLGKYKPGSVYSFFNKTKTPGGARLLEHMFLNPFTDDVLINKRSQLIRHYAGMGLDFPFEHNEPEQVENYLNGQGAASILTNATSVIVKKILSLTVSDPRYAELESSIIVTSRILKTFVTLAPVFGMEHLSAPFSKLKFNNGNWTSIRLITCHQMFTSFKKEISQVIDFIYQLDVFLTIGKIAGSADFCYPVALPKTVNHLKATDLRHPCLEKAVGNDLEFNTETNVLFLTGANMAGKSTLMKAMGISVYLAHMGFPVAAKEMRFSVRDGMYSSINVADSLKNGYSHFYAEVLRVKTVAKRVAAGKRLMVIFDELFKGTNVKDAYDATLKVTAEFAAYRKCTFIISTHIVEAGEALMESTDGIRFEFLPTLMVDAAVSYPYKLESGISTDRHGMMIIINEGILDLLSAGSNG